MRSASRYDSFFFFFCRHPRRNTTIYFPADHIHHLSGDVQILSNTHGDVRCYPKIRTKQSMAACALLSSTESVLVINYGGRGGKQTSEGTTSWVTPSQIFPAIALHSRT